MVVDFTVVDDPQTLVLVANRLLSGPNVDNAEPPHSQPDVTFDKKALIVRSAMHDSRIHLRQPVALKEPFLPGIQNSADSAHISGSPRWSQDRSSMLTRARPKRAEASLSSQEHFGPNRIHQNSERT